MKTIDINKMKNNYYRSPEVLEKKDGKFWVFLAGPIQGSTDWRKQIIQEFESNSDIVFLDPKVDNYAESTFIWENQVDWETRALALSDIVLFWIPLEDEGIPGRSYAQTTRTELGEWMTKTDTLGKKILVGIEDGFSGKKYLVRRLSEVGVETKSTLQDLLDELKIYTARTEPKTYFTADTHFGSERTWFYNKRPFLTVEKMDLEIIQKWNSRVKPWDKVYHIGDFGDYEAVKYLNGDITIVLGNHDQDEKEKLDLDMVQFHDYLLEKGFTGTSFSSLHVEIGDKAYVLSHKPLTGKDNLEEGEMCLFGHIHRAGQVKEFGLNVGVDTNMYFPYSEEEVSYFRNAIENHYGPEDFAK